MRHSTLVMYSHTTAADKSKHNSKELEYIPSGGPRGDGLHSESSVTADILLGTRGIDNSAKSVVPENAQVYIHPTLVDLGKTPRPLLPRSLPRPPMPAPNSTIQNFVTGEDNQLVAVVVGAAAILMTTVIYYALSSKDKVHDFPKLRGVQLYHAWNFFQRRFDFLQWNLQRNLGKSFSFNVLHHTVVVLSGEDARQVFYATQHFNLKEGYRLLKGAARICFPLFNRAFY